MCPYWCVLYQASSQFDQSKLASECNYSRPWAISKRSQTPTLQQLIMQDHLNYECFMRVGTHLVGHFRGNCTQTWDVTSGKRHLTGSPPPEGAMDSQTIPLADIWWLCGQEGGLRSTLPLRWEGTCTSVMLLQEVIMSPEVQSNANFPEQRTLLRQKRKYDPDPTIRIDSTGQPRGIPNEFKARNEIAAGWEAIIPVIGVSKNVEWINYVYYNQQRFIKYTDDALEALGQQLDATSRMAWQNRQVLDWLLAEKGGVCVMFGEQCCTFIPNNTSTEGSFTRAMNKLKNLRTEVKQNAGFGHKFFDWLENRLGGWGAWLTKMAITVSIVLLSCALVLCCFLPCLKSLIVRDATKQFPMLVAITEASLVEKETPKMYRYSLQHLQDEQEQNDSVGGDCKGF
ncbi:syncytin-A-like [Hypanus sabinus]|uniref:syncytin-A-like n=1 Tax=Hypanus sabinus TaxID=79690 RepID=UPI0028C4FC2F|nr:syncytin-A-like [Hypanus sabinus]